MAELPVLPPWMAPGSLPNQDWQTLVDRLGEAATIATVACETIACPAG
jgi:hypothetical protein